MRFTTNPPKALVKYIVAFLVRPDKNRTRFFVFFTLAIFLVVGTNVAISQPEGISGCVNKKTGILRIAAKCSSSERTIQWSVFGPPGPQGPKGDVGDRGVQGLPGLSIVSGKGMPNAFVGEEGDFFIDVLTYKIYGPKKGESWGEPRDLVGPKGDIGPIGPQGSKGEIGPAGPTGAQGPAGPTGAQGPAGPTGAQGPAGARGEKGDTGNSGIVNASDSLGLIGQLIFSDKINTKYQFKFPSGKIWNYFGTTPQILNNYYVFFPNELCLGDAYYVNGYDSSANLESFLFAGLVKILKPAVGESEPAGNVAALVTGERITIDPGTYFYLFDSGAGVVCQSAFLGSTEVWVLSSQPETSIPRDISFPLRITS